jgi:DNA-binding MarR family transcriptional regulator
MTIFRTPVSPMQCRLLSELALHPRDGVSPTSLARAAGFNRPTTDALLKRLRDARMVRAERAGEIRSQVRYIITAKGEKARARFARDVGLQIPKGER